MKKIYTTLFLSAVAIFSFAQSGRIATAKPAVIGAAAKQTPVVQPMNTDDTLTNHWDVIAPVPVDTATTYSSSSGFVAGQNDYGDISKMQKFDGTYGVTQGGTINGLLLWFGAKMVGAGTASFTATIWADNGGVPGAILGTAPAFTIGQIDTSVAGLKIIGPVAAIEGAYNTIAMFSPKINIPSNMTFWAGINYTYAAGDSAGLVTSRDGNPGDAAGATGNFGAASTHTFEEWNDNSFHSFNDGTTNTWQLDVALAVYPVVTFGNTSVNELNSSIASVQNTPNPAVSSTLINYDLKENANVTLSVVDITGAEILSAVQGEQAQGSHSVKLDVSDLSAGMYFYTIKAGDHQVTKKMTVIK